jgi:CubicO group peptidase (beta-lactamase class C family)
MKRGSGLLSFLLIFLSISHSQNRAANNSPQLSELLQRAAATHSDAVLVFKDGKPLAEYYSKAGKRKIELMSCTKSIVNSGIGRLIDQGKIKSLDQLVYEFYPEWKQGRKKLITIRHLLDHTSGLQDLPTTVEVNLAPDFIQLALAAELKTDPGKVFFYNNKAVNLLAGIIERASGKRMDIYFRDEIFKPMGIVDFNWATDRAGNPPVMAGLKLTAEDFAKFGELILNKGLWGSTRIVSERWIEESMTPQAAYYSYGLLWWLMPADMDIVMDDEKFKELEDAKVDPALIQKLQPLRNKVMHSGPESDAALLQALNMASPGSAIDQEIRSKGLRLWNFKVREVKAYNANGDLGQYLVIYPKARLVAVRQISSRIDYNGKTDGFEDFSDLVQKIGDLGP